VFTIAIIIIIVVSASERATTNAARSHALPFSSRFPLHARLASQKDGRFDVQEVERYDDEVWSKHEAFLAANQEEGATATAYDPDIHYSVLLVGATRRTHISASGPRDREEGRPTSGPSTSCVARQR